MKVHYLVPFSLNFFTLFYTIFHIVGSGIDLFSLFRLIERMVGAWETEDKKTLAYFGHILRQLHIIILWTHTQAATYNNTLDTYSGSYI